MNVIVIILKIFLCGEFLNGLFIQTFLAILFQGHVGLLFCFESNLKSPNSKFIDRLMIEQEHGIFISKDLFQVSVSS